MLIRIIRLLRLQVEVTIDAIMMATALIANDLSVAMQSQHYKKVCNEHCYN
jgi:hypothetical protein